MLGRGSSSSRSTRRRAEIWIHEGLGGINARGINYWQSEDGKDKRLLFSVNSFLQAIDAKTGKSIPTFGLDGIVDLRTGLARAEGTNVGVQSGNPGKVWKDLLILGSAPGEGFISPPGDIRAYNVVTGKKVWQFGTVPKPGEYGYDTWPAEAHKYIGGNNNWGSMSVDEERGIVFIPTGSATYDFYGADRHGANLFANSILALDTRTGRRLWHFRRFITICGTSTTCGAWLVTIRHDGKRIDAVAHAARPDSSTRSIARDRRPVWRRRAAGAADQRPGRAKLADTAGRPRRRHSDGRPSG